MPVPQKLSKCQSQLSLFKNNRNFRRPFVKKKSTSNFQTFYFLKLCPIFVKTALNLLTKYNNFLEKCSVSA